MINIISTQAKKAHISGPHKVFSNLVKGLEKIDYPFVVNKDLNATKRLYIHDDVEALYYLRKTESKCVVGPNLFILPNEIKKDISLEETLYLQPCNWVKKLWEFLGFNVCSIKAWPVGIDTGAFVPRRNEPADARIMVYHKERDPKELNMILDYLNSMKLEYNLIYYGKYQESEYRNLLCETSFVIWHGRHESQGIALQEALACNVPILVCDVTKLSQQYNRDWDKKLDAIRVTSAPYFDGTCGKKITELSDLRNSVEYMFDNLSGFRPREYIRKNLSLEKQAKELVVFWEYWGLSYGQGLYESTNNTREWKIPLSDRVLKNVHSALGRVIRKLRKMSFERLLH